MDTSTSIPSSLWQRFCDQHRVGLTPVEKFPGVDAQHKNAIFLNEKMAFLYFCPSFFLFYQPYSSGNKIC
ncbi:hypothetical protein ACTHOQ_01025 [Solibacillus silvestris]|uniref:hypothetical protein n=1 Tax=Solibacillus silvestris TaxID=76853 RepID=UPI003F7E6968